MKSYVVYIGGSLHISFPIDEAKPHEAVEKLKKELARFTPSAKIEISIDMDVTNQFWPGCAGKRDHVCGLQGYGHPDDPPCPGCIDSGRIKA